MPTRRVSTRRVGRPCKGGSLGYGKRLDRAKKFAYWVKNSALPWMKKHKAVSRGSQLALKYGRKHMGKYAGHVDRLGKYAGTKGYGRGKVVRRKKRLGGSLGYY